MIGYYRSAHHQLQPGGRTSILVLAPVNLLCHKLAFFIGHGYTFSPFPEADLLGGVTFPFR